MVDQGQIVLIKPNVAEIRLSRYPHHLLFLNGCSKVMQYAVKVAIVLLLAAEVSLVMYS